MLQNSADRILHDKRTRVSDGSALNDFSSHAEGQGIIPGRDVDLDGNTTVPSSAEPRTRASGELAIGESARLESKYIRLKIKNTKLETKNALLEIKLAGLEEVCRLGRQNSKQR